MTIKMLGGLAAAVLMYAIGHSAYMHVNGYPAWQIEADFCKGRMLVEQDIGDVSTLVCSHTKIGNPIQVAFRQYQINPDKMYMLEDMVTLCNQRKEEPRDMGGKLGCMRKSKLSVSKN